MPTAIRVSKGHGTRNDFVLVADLDGQLDLSADLVRALSDRHAGVGGDGLIRLVGAEVLPEGRALVGLEPSLRWFMDYRNADGSVAQMCGNGVRVLAAWLVRQGRWEPADGDLLVGTRAGVRRVRSVPAVVGTDPWYAVDMGPWSLPGGAAAAAAGTDAQVQVPGIAGVRPALAVDVGNAHRVIALGDPAELAAADLSRAPQVDPVPPDGANVELVVPLGEARLPDGTRAGHLRMRVHERGVGETQSCGTGACAAAVAVRTWGGTRAPSTWLVDVLGGTLQVRMLEDGHVELAGPATIVADADVDLSSLGGGV